MFQTTNITMFNAHMFHVWNMNPNICPSPKSPSFVGKYINIPAPWFAYGIGKATIKTIKYIPLG